MHAELVVETTRSNVYLTRDLMSIYNKENTEQRAWIAPVPALVQVPHTTLNLKFRVRRRRVTHWHTHRSTPVQVTPHWQPQPEASRPSFRVSFTFASEYCASESPVSANALAARAIVLRSHCFTDQRSFPHYRLRRRLEVRATLDSSMTAGTGTGSLRLSLRLLIGW